MCTLLGRKEENVQVLYLNFLAAVVIIFYQQVDVIRVKRGYHRKLVVRLGCHNSVKVTWKIP